MALRSLTYEAKLSSSSPVRAERKGQFVSDASRAKRRGRTFPCPRCKNPMEEIVRIEPTLGEAGLIGYECPDCGYVTSELVRPKERY